MRVGLLIWGLPDSAEKAERVGLIHDFAALRSFRLAL